MNIAAFFDIDGTLYRDALIIEHFKKLIKYDIIDQKYWYNNVRDTFMNWDKRQGNYDDYLEKVCKIYVDAIKGLNNDYIDFTSNQVIRLKSDRIYKYTRNRIDWHHKQGHKIIFISGSPDFLVSKMAKKYNADDFEGSKYIFENGIFTGNVEPMWNSESKNNAIDKFKKKFDIDLDNSYAYGDTNGDIQMFKRVGNPVAINPTKELLKAIINSNEISSKIKIIVERKDIIYSLKPDVEIFDL
ncbi:MAG: HAD-IB family hydrolase [Clostridioides sp.]|jgi:HAD superfamily hydrolase (TIGR01490 family)|nr:HAD-IB family hydrolase [Clostridioides sp.]